MKTPLGRVQEKKAALDALRPLAAASLVALDAWYDVELTYTSNALEGNTLTRSETAIVLEKGITVGGKPLKDHLEAAGHKDALGYVRASVSDAAPVLESDIRNIHRLVLQRDRSRGGGLLQQSSADDLGVHADAAFACGDPVAHGRLCRVAASRAETPVTAFDAHEGLVTIHPFSDGNGRTARLLMNLLLLKMGYPPAVILPEDRAAYHESLQAVELRTDRDAWHQFMFARLESALDHYLEIVGRGLAP